MRDMNAYGRRAFLLTSLLLALFAMAWPFKPALADPHATFYTAIGQQQLFFNVLAALDQAEYVETPAKRQVLVQNRATGEPSQKAENNPVITKTNTNLSSILTRTITLEGNDLWTAYLAHQFALEAARRENTDEVLRIYCERGLGRPGCKDTEETNQKLKEEERKKAFIVDPVGYVKDAVLGGATSALSSNLSPGSADQVDRRDAIKNDQGNTNPPPFDSYLAELKEQTKDDPEAQRTVDRLIALAENAFIPDRIEPDLLSDINFENGKFTLAIKPPSNRSRGVAYADSGQKFINTYTSKLAAFIGAPGDILATATRGANEVQTFAEAKEDRGALADSELYPKAEASGGSASTTVIKTVEGRLTVPAHAKTAATETALDTLGTTEQNLQHAPADAEFLPGQQELVERGGQTTGAQAVLGINTSTNSASPANQNVGRVLHAVTSNEDAGDHDAQTKRLSADTIAAGFHHEHGAGLLLEAIGYKGNRGGCGCSDEGVANDYGQVIIKKINGYSPP